MKVTCKTVTGTSFDVAAEPSTSVSAVRALIEAAKPELSGDTLIVIHQGKILKDEDTLAGVGFGDSSFLVLMTKPKKKEEAKLAPAAAGAAPEAAEAAGGGEPSSAAAATAAEPAAAAPAAAAPASGAGEATTAASGEGDAYTATASQLMTGEALEASVASICEMGFERAQVQRAMRAAFNNPERAVEYLMSGIPEEADLPPAAAAGAPAAAGAAAPGTAAAAAAPPSGPNAQPLDLFAPPGSTGAAGAGASGPLDFLRSNVQFNALRSIVQANPQVLEPMLAELGRAQPDLLALINANQAEFLRLVNEPVSGGGVAGGGGLAELSAALGGGAGGGGQQLPPGAVAVQLTPEEIEAVGRLEALGFERHAAVEAFLACDKNEALAANFLFENPDEGDEDDGAGGGGAGA